MGDLKQNQPIMVRQLWSVGLFDTADSSNHNFPDIIKYNFGGGKTCTSCSLPFFLFDLNKLINLHAMVIFPLFLVGHSKR